MDVYKVAYNTMCNLVLQFFVYIYCIVCMYFLFNVGTNKLDFVSFLILLPLVIL